MALGIAIPSMPVNTAPEEWQKRILFPEGVYQGKSLRSMTVGEAVLFNMDLDGIASGYAHPQIREALESYQEQILLATRAVMYSARQPYGGAVAVGDEICMRAIRPIDCALASDIWDWNLTGETPISAVTRISAATLGEEAAMVIVGFAETALDTSVVTAWQAVLGGKTYPYLTLKFTASNKDYSSFMKTQIPVVVLPEQTVTINMACARAQYAYTEVIGVAICKAIQFRTVNTDIIY